MLKIGKCRTPRGSLASLLGRHQYDAGRKVLRFATGHLFSRHVRTAAPCHDQRGDCIAPDSGMATARNSSRTIVAKAMPISNCDVLTSASRHLGASRRSDRRREREKHSGNPQNMSLCAILRHSFVTTFSRFVRDVFRDKRILTGHSVTRKSPVLNSA